MSIQTRSCVSNTQHLLLVYSKSLALRVRPRRLHLMQNTPSIDITGICGHVYKKTWAERRYLAKMIIIPLLIKYTCFAVASVYMAQDSIIRIAFFMLPSYLIEGWFLAHWARTVVMDHRWPFKPSGNQELDTKVMSARGRGVMGGLVAFTLINFLMTGYFAYFLSLLPVNLDPQTASPEVGIIGLVMLVTAFMLFRYIWSYIPLALNIRLVDYAKLVQQASMTFPMIGIWVCCFIPPFIIMQISGGLIEVATIGVESKPPIVEGISMFVRVFLDMIKNLLTTAAFACMVMALISGNKA